MAAAGRTRGPNILHVGATKRVHLKKKKDYIFTLHFLPAYLPHYARTCTAVAVVVDLFLMSRKHIVRLITVKLISGVSAVRPSG